MEHPTFFKFGSSEDREIGSFTTASDLPISQTHKLPIFNAHFSPSIAAETIPPA